MAAELPTPDQIKATVDAGQAAWTAIEHFMTVVSWVGPWIVTFSASITAASKSVQNIPFLGPILNTLGLNIGAAKNR
jgi:hypothetical protein